MQKVNVLVTGFINGYKSFIRWATNNKTRKEKKKIKARKKKG